MAAARAAPNSAGSGHHMSVPAAVGSSLDGLLEQHPNRVELIGSLRSLAFPSRCANCGAMTTERLPVRKVFGRASGYRRRAISRRYIGYRIDTARVPYCPACIAQDARERQSLASRWRSRLGGILIRSFPAVFPLGFAVFLLTTIQPPTHPREATGGFERALALLFGLSGAGLIGYGWWDTRNCLVPKQTSVTLAFDFSPDVSDLLDYSERRVYAMREAAFAEAFTALNRARVWLPDPAVDRAERRVWIACAVFLAIAALAAAFLNL
jgi:hypothetical protein